MKYRVEPLTPEQLRRFYRVTRSLRDPIRTLLWLLPVTGLTVAEAVSLRAQDVGVCADPLHPGRTIPGITVFSRFLPLAPGAVNILRAYLGSVSLDNWLFPGLSGKTLATGSVHNALRGVVGLHPELAGTTTHALRLTYALNCIRAGVSMRELQQRLGIIGDIAMRRYRLLSDAPEPTPARTPALTPPDSPAEPSPSAAP